MVDRDNHRKLVAILCADVAGYSRMIGEDEEGTLAALSANMAEVVEPAVIRHGGRIFKTTGDGFLAEFASPIAAAHAALEIQEGLRPRNADLAECSRQLLRMGLNLGDVVVRDGDIFGDAVNVAARLQAAAEPGCVQVSAAVADQLRGHTAFVCEDLGEKTFKNIARPVKTYRLVPATPGMARTGRRAAPAPRPRMLVAGFGVVVAALVAIALYWISSVPSPPAGQPLAGRSSEVGKPSIAVLPFVNQSGDPSTDYFSDGVTEDIISGLGRFPELTVMAYNATLPYKGRAAPPAQVGRDLNVRYLIEGSVRRMGDRVRVSVRLTDAQPGNVIWSQEFNEQLQDVFALQETVARRVAGTLAASLGRVEQQRALAKPTANLDAYDLFLRGRAKQLLATRSGNQEARRLYEQALEADPGYAAVHAGLGWAYLEMADQGWTEQPGEMLARAEQFARKALSLDRDNIDAHLLLSEVQSIQLQHERALAEVDLALTLNPSDAAGHAQRGAILLWTGRSEEAVTELERAYALDPNLHPGEIFILGLAYYTARRHQDAVRLLERASLRDPDYAYFPVVLAASYAQLGRQADANRASEAARRRLPRLDPAVFGSRFQNSADHSYLIDGMRKAGLVEG